MEPQKWWLEEDPFLFGAFCNSSGVNKLAVKLRGGAWVERWSMATLPGWYLTQLSTMIYVPFFACMAGTGITQQAVKVSFGWKTWLVNLEGWYTFLVPEKTSIFSWMEMVKHDLFRLGLSSNWNIHFNSWIFQVPGFIVTILMITILQWTPRWSTTQPAVGESKYKQFTKSAFRIRHFGGIRYLSQQCHCEIIFPYKSSISKKTSGQGDPSHPIFRRPDCRWMPL